MTKIVKISLVLLVVVLIIHFDNFQALMDSNLPRLQLELYKEIKKVRHGVVKWAFCNTSYMSLLSDYRPVLDVKRNCLTFLSRKYGQILDMVISVLVWLNRMVPLGVWGQLYGGLLSLPTSSDRRNAGMQTYNFFTFFFKPLSTTCLIL